LNQESSPDHLAFQVAHTTFSPNYPGEELETLDRQILAVSVDVPPQDGETDENANAARAVRRQQELAAAALGGGQQTANVGQVNANVGQQAPTAPAAPQQQPRAAPQQMIYLVPTDCARETSSGTSSTMDSKFTTRHKQTWEPLLLL
jgi:hypothetical protein